MKDDKFLDSELSVFDILIAPVEKLTLYGRNENVTQVLTSDYLQTTYPIYAELIDRQFRKGVVKKELVDGARLLFYCIYTKDRMTNCLNCHSI